MAQRGISLVYGGASVGLMGTLADAVLQAGGRAVGVIPQHIVDREVAHRGLSELRIVGTMAERKRIMAELSDAFIALPGGLGTLDEVFEVATEAQLGLHKKPIVLLDTHDYYAPLVRFLDGAHQSGLLTERTRAIVRYTAGVEQALRECEG